MILIFMCLSLFKLGFSWTTKYFHFSQPTSSCFDRLNVKRLPTLFPLSKISKCLLFAYHHHCHLIIDFLEKQSKLKLECAIMLSWGKNDLIYIILQGITKICSKLTLRIILWFSVPEIISHSSEMCDSCKTHFIDANTYY